MLTGSAYYSSNRNDDSTSVNEDCSSSDNNGEDLEMSSSGLEIFTHTDVHPDLFEPELLPSETPSGTPSGVFIVEESSSVICMGNTNW